MLVPDAALSSHRVRWMRVIILRSIGSFAVFAAETAEWEAERAAEDSGLCGNNRHRAVPDPYALAAPAHSSKRSQFRLNRPPPWPLKTR